MEETTVNEEKMRDDEEYHDEYQQYLKENEPLAKLGLGVGFDTWRKQKRADKEFSLEEKKKRHEFFMKNTLKKILKGDL